MAQPVAPATTAAATTPAATPAPAPQRPVYQSAEEARAARSGHEMMVLPYDPQSSVPIRSMAEDAAASVSSEKISQADAARARRIQTEMSDDLERHLPDEGERDIFDRDRDATEPDLKSPTIEIYGTSLVRLAGSDNTFYPQTIGLVGHESGGGLGLVQPIQFPMVFYSFGQSVLLSQQGPVSGTWDPATGQVTLQMPVAFVDSDGDTAVVQLELTTGTAFARNAQNEVVAMTGTPRQPGSGLARLVGLEKLEGPAMMYEGHLAQFEVLARIDFATSISSSFRSGLRNN
jgi:hypothetical protein